MENTGHDHGPPLRSEAILTIRLPRLRFTVRRLMLVVAIAALAMGGGVWGYRMSLLSGQ
jgi:hypothetical protein